MITTSITFTQSILLAILRELQALPIIVLLALFIASIIAGICCLYLLILALAPYPRAPRISEKTYLTTTPSGGTETKQLPCWHDEWLAHRQEAELAVGEGVDGEKEEIHTGSIDEAQLEMSVVVPAFNEEARIEVMLEEAVEWLDVNYGRVASRGGNSVGKNGWKNGKGKGGYEILVVDDGSKDRTVEVVLAFARKHELHDVLRVVRLEHNRGKGGAVTHGFRHVRGRYTVFVDADGASRFSDLGKLVEGCEAVCDQPGRGVAVGSRAHLVGSEAVVKRSALRNALMHSFHLLLQILTPPATSRIRDTQCGFKVFSRAALPHIVPYMHVEGWIFDVEILLLAESAPEGVVTSSGGSRIGTTPGIRVAEVPIGWKEVGGSKLNVVWDSLGMAWGLALLRASWMFGVYRRR